MNNRMIGATAVLLCLGAYAAASVYVNAQAEKRIDEELVEFNAASPLVVTKESVSSSLLSQEVALNKVSIAATEGECAGVVATVEKLSGFHFDDNPLEPGAGDLVLQGISVPIHRDCMKHADEIIEMLGGDTEIRADVEASYVLDEEGNYSVDMIATVDALAETKFALDLGGMTAALGLMQQAVRSPDQTPDINPLAFSDITLSRIKFEYTDRGLKEYAVNQAAEESGMSADDFLAQELAKFRSRKEDVLGDIQGDEMKALAEEAMTALEKFTASHDRIGIDIKMKEPVKLMEAYMKVMMSVALNKPVDLGEMEYEFYN